MAYSNVWDATRPQGTVAASSIDDEMRAFRVDIQERLITLFGLGAFTADPLQGIALNLKGSATSKIIPGATSLSLRNNADSADNLIITDAGLATFRNTVTAPLFSGNVSGSAATVTAAAQPAITSLGILSGLTSSGSIFLNTNNTYLQGKTSGGVTVNLLTVSSDANSIMRFMPAVNAAGFQWTDQAQATEWMRLGLQLLTVDGNINISHPVGHPQLILGSSGSTRGSLISDAANTIKLLDSGGTTIATFAGSGFSTGSLALTGGATIAGALTVGATGSGTGGVYFVKDDGGSNRWALGTLGSIGGRDFLLYDNVNNITRLTISATTGGIIITNNLYIAAASSKIIPGATSLSLRNNADTADNLIITDAGNATIRGSLTVTGALIAGTVYYAKSSATLASSGGNVDIAVVAGNQYRLTIWDSTDNFATSGNSVSYGVYIIMVIGSSVAAGAANSDTNLVVAQGTGLTVRIQNNGGVTRYIRYILEQLT